MLDAAIAISLQIAICGQLIVLCESSCQAQNSHHAIVVRPILSVTGGTQFRCQKIVSRVGGGGVRHDLQAG